MKQEKEMFDMIENWKQSGVSKKEFFRGSTFSMAKLEYWVNKYNKQYDSNFTKPKNQKDFQLFKELDFSKEVQVVTLKKIIEVTTPMGVQITIFG